MNFDRNISFHHPKVSLGTKLFVYSMLSVILLVLDGHFHLFASVRQTVSVPLYPLQWIMNEPKRLMNLGRSYFIDQEKLVDENQQLQKQLLQQHMQLSRVKTLERELNQLKQLLHINTEQAHILGAAEVLNTGNDPFSYQLIIGNSGRQAFRLGQPVVDQQGLLGVITQVGAHSSEVTLAINTGQMLPVMIERTGERSILYGDGGGFDLRYMPQHADVKKGDVLVTSGLDNVYPRGLPVAEVTVVHENEGAQFLRVDCKPMAGMQKVRYVLVIDNPETDYPVAPLPEDSSLPVQELGADP